MRLSITFALVIMVSAAAPLLFIGNLGIEAKAAQSKPLPTVTSIPSAPSTIGQDGKEGEFSTQAAIGSLTARPTNNIVNTNSFYDVVYLTTTSGAIKFIEVTFPAGTTVPTSAVFNEAEGIGPGFISQVSGQKITYTVNNAVNVPAGTKIRLEFANINNPLHVSANYKVTVTTKNANNVIIDGPTQSTPYTIKQIGKNAIAKGAIVPQTNTFAGDGAAVPPGQDGSDVVTCPSSHPILTGGGYFVSPFLPDEFMTPITSVQQQDSNRWSVTMHNSHPSETITFFARATCMAPMP